ncbi:hypothetical protein JTB14_002713 [Gonioctena quinquepunctata]|nr:hypothetical protein JTB14_002713 [Gonioctena quinquepunctata]
MEPDLANPEPNEDVVVAPNSGEALVVAAPKIEGCTVEVVEAAPKIEGCTVEVDVTDPKIDDCVLAVLAVPNTEGCVVDPPPNIDPCWLDAPDEPNIEAWLVVTGVVPKIDEVVVAAVAVPKIEGCVVVLPKTDACVVEEVLVPNIEPLPKVDGLVVALLLLLPKMEVEVGTGSVLLPKMDVPDAETVEETPNNGVVVLVLETALGVLAVAVALVKPNIEPVGFDVDALSEDEAEEILGVLLLPKIEVVPLVVILPNIDVVSDFVKGWADPDGVEEVTSLEPNAVLTAVVLLELVSIVGALVEPKIEEVPNDEVVVAEPIEEGRVINGPKVGIELVAVEPIVDGFVIDVVVTSADDVVVTDVPKVELVIPVEPNIDFVEKVVVTGAEDVVITDDDGSVTVEMDVDDGLLPNIPDLLLVVEVEILSGTLVLIFSAEETPLVLGKDPKEKELGVVVTATNGELLLV